MLDVKENSIRNEYILEHLDCQTLLQQMELRRARWLEKMSNMPANRNPRKVLISWTQQKRPVGRPKQTIRHGYATTVVKSLGFDNAGLNSWMTVAKDHSSWAQQVELHLELPTDTYKPFKQRRN